MEYKELCKLVNTKENSATTATFKHISDKDKALTFTYYTSIDFSTIYQTINAIVSESINDVSEINNDEYEIDYTISEGFIIYMVLKIFTNLDLNGDINLAYQLNAEYNIINQLLEDDIVRSHINFIYNNIWKYLEFKKMTKAGEAVDKIFYNIQSLFASFGLSKMLDNNIDIDDFINNYIKEEQLKSLDEDK